MMSIVISDREFNRVRDNEMALDNHGRVLRKPYWYSADEVERIQRDSINTIVRLQRIISGERLTNQLLRKKLRGPQKLIARRRLHWLLKLLVK